MRSDALVPLFDYRGIVESYGFSLRSHVVKTTISALEHLLPFRRERHNCLLVVRRRIRRGNDFLQMQVYLVIIWLNCKRPMEMLVMAGSEGLMPALTSSWCVVHKLTPIDDLLLLWIIGWSCTTNPRRFRYYVIDSTGMWLMLWWVQSELTRIREPFFESHLILRMPLFHHIGTWIGCVSLYFVQAFRSLDIYRMITSTLTSPFSIYICTLFAVTSAGLINWVSLRGYLLSQPTYLFESLESRLVHSLSMLKFTRW